MARTARRNPQAGVSLVEALVALAVMAFGMLALVGVQSTMRFNNDLSKQRTEATRIAHEELERLRVFVSMAPVAGQPNRSWDEIAGRGPVDYVPQDGIGNTTFSVRRTVSTLPLADGNVAGAAPRKVLRVRVQWTDRTGVAQTITLDSLVAGADPALSALLTVPPLPSATNQLNGRHPSVPVEAVTLPGDRSGFKPFDRGNTVWVFDNATGYIVSRCTGVTATQSAITQADLTNCSVVDGRRLAGYVQFDLGSTPSSERPAGPMLPLQPSAPVEFAGTVSGSQTQATPASCVANSPGSQADGQVPRARGFAVRYECIVFPASALGWGGRLEVRLDDRYANGDSLPGASQPSDYRVCRYTSDLPTADDPYAEFIENIEHPRTYCVERRGIPTTTVPCIGRRVTTNLLNQNFLVVRQSAACPADNAATPLINGNTQPHQS